MSRSRRCWRSGGMLYGGVISHHRIAKDGKFSRGVVIAGAPEVCYSVDYQSPQNSHGRGFEGSYQSRYRVIVGSHANSEVVDGVGLGRISATAGGDSQLPGCSWWPCEMIGGQGRAIGWNIILRKVAKTTIRGLLLDRGCRDAVDSHAESFGGHVARLSYRVECTPPQNSQGRGLGSPSNSGTGTLLAIIRRSRCRYRVECNPPQDSKDRIRGLLLQSTLA